MWPTRATLLEVSLVTPDDGHIRVVTAADSHDLVGHLVVSLVVTFDYNQLWTEFLRYVSCGLVRM